MTIVGARYLDEDQSSLEITFGDGRVGLLMADTENTDYKEILNKGILIDPYTDAPDKRTYREKRAQRYTDELTDGGEMRNPIVAIGDVLDDIITAFVAEYPDYADPRTAKGQTGLGQKIAKIQAIKREIPKS